jgi:hypothetical protein
MDQLAGTTSTGGIELVSDDLRIDGVRAASSVYERTVALCEARRDAAEKAWRDAEQEHQRLGDRAGVATSTASSTPQLCVRASPPLKDWLSHAPWAEHTGVRAERSGRARMRPPDARRARTGWLSR